MATTGHILCDGCGQPADAEHIARRIKRLENMTRYRPIHVQALFLGAASPGKEGEYLYSAENAFSGEGAALLSALEVSTLGRTVEATLLDFQRRGYLLAHLRDCGDTLRGEEARRESLLQRVPAALTRIRRSFKPKWVVLLGSELAELVPQFTAANLDSVLVLQNGKPFEWNKVADGQLVKELATSLRAL
jgi:hypothetical protein